MEAWLKCQSTYLGNTKPGVQPPVLPRKKGGDVSVHTEHISYSRRQLDTQSALDSGYREAEK
jgi:hypothetical protein